MKAKGTLADIAELQVGFAFKSEGYGDDGTLGPRLLRGDNIGQGSLRWDGAKRWSEPLEDDRYHLRAADVVIAMDRPWVGAGLKFATVRTGDLPALLVQRVARLRAKPGNHQSYLHHVVGGRAFTDHILAVQTGTAVPHVSGSQILSFRVEPHSLEEQRGIAEVLGALDDKIAANARLASTGWALAKAAFAQLQQAATTDVAVGEILTLEYGKSLPASARMPGNVAVFGSGGSVGVHDTALVDRPGIVIGRKGSAGSVHWAPGPHFPIDTTFFVVPAAADVPLTFCYFALASLRLDEMNSDSAVPGLNRGAAHAAKVRLPDAAARMTFDATAGPLFVLAAQIEHESGHLAKMRDALLPQLMSGKIRVKDAERVVEGVV